MTAETPVMKKTDEQITLTASEIEYVYNCWKQVYSNAYKNFEDYLKMAIIEKKAIGSVYS